MIGRLTVNGARYTVFGHKFQRNQSSSNCLIYFENLVASAPLIMRWSKSMVIGIINLGWKASFLQMASFLLAASTEGISGVYQMIKDKQ